MHSEGNLRISADEDIDERELPELQILSVPEEPYVTVILNGLTIINCTLGGDLEEPLSAVSLNGSRGASYFHILASTAFEIKGMYRVELEFLGPDGTHEFPFGNLTEENSELCGAVCIPFNPTSVRMSCRKLEPSEYSHSVDESRFTDDVVSLLRSGLNSFGGSLASALLQNYAKHLYHYKSVVVKKYEGSWHQYLNNNKHVFNVFQKKEDEIAQQGLSPYIKPHEVRVVLVEQEDWMEVDQRIAEKWRYHEKSLISNLTDTFKDLTEGMDQRAVMDCLEDNEHFLHFISPSFSTLYRFLVQHRDIFTWTKHEHLPLCVGLADPERQGEPLDL
eukprot:TRINITY_DN1418_c6_g1_i1.p1 TRINITY_DN1418_c6_g1~~TRINITY_DN1418_c6_g1_i1.p1  ORF type:complete len:358 (+),score=46.37 TRINITY_DN1418_c6_g1_i1:76-1074(+)